MVSVVWLPHSGFEHNSFATWLQRNRMYVLCTFGIISALLLMETVRMQASHEIMWMAMYETATKMATTDCSNRYTEESCLSQEVRLTDAIVHQKTGCQWVRRECISMKVALEKMYVGGIVVALFVLLSMIVYTLAAWAFTDWAWSENAIEMPTVEASGQKDPTELVCEEDEEEDEINIHEEELYGEENAVVEKIRLEDLDMVPQSAILENPPYHACPKRVREWMDFEIHSIACAQQTYYSILIPTRKQPTAIVNGMIYREMNNGYIPLPCPCEHPVTDYSRRFALPKHIIGQPLNLWCVVPISWIRDRLNMDGRHLYRIARPTGNRSYARTPESVEWRGDMSLVVGVDFSHCLFDEAASMDEEEFDPPEIVNVIDHRLQKYTVETEWLHAEDLKRALDASSLRWKSNLLLLTPHEYATLMKPNDCSDTTNYPFFAASTKDGVLYAIASDPGCTFVIKHVKNTIDDFEKRSLAAKLNTSDPIDSEKLESEDKEKRKDDLLASHKEISDLWRQSMRRNNKGCK